jgi:hypothetical protein
MLILFCSSVLLVVTTILTAECTAYWQILLCQGFGYGVQYFLMVQLSLMILNIFFPI